MKHNVFSRIVWLKLKIPHAVKKWQRSLSSKYLFYQAQCRYVSDVLAICFLSGPVSTCLHKKNNR